MDSQAVNSAGNPEALKPKQRSSSGSGSKITPTPDPKPSGDSVDLSPEAKTLSEGAPSGQASVSSEQRKLSVTDENDVVLKVIDPKTQKVVKSVPTEEQIQLKNAVRDGINDITE